MVLVAFILLVFGYGLVSRRLERTVITAPILFTLAGMLLQPVLDRIEPFNANGGALLLLAEIGLVMLLFTDASRTDLRFLKSIRNLAARLLSAGMLLTIVLGAVAARIVFPELSIWEAGILAAILAPTDAGLGQIIVNSPLVPLRIRQALNVEAGLNDGLSVPFLLFFMALAVAGTHGDHPGLSRFIVEQLGYGTLVGIGIGVGGGWLLGLAQRREWMAHTCSQTALLALPVLCLLVSEWVGASMFIAAFVAGLAVQVGFKEVARHSIEFTEEWGQLLNFSVFFLFGMLSIRSASGLGGSALVYAVLSLTVVRMLPVAIALAGAGLSRPTVLFMGWFGPRGLASIVLGLVYLEHELHLPGEHTIRLAVIATVMLSIFAHGLSAMPGINWYARQCAARGNDA
jgi:NhaP-type Na+/H+ or K+/H+ antiporter